MICIWYVLPFLKAQFCPVSSFNSLDKIVSSGFLAGTCSTFVCVILCAPHWTFYNGSALRMYSLVILSFYCWEQLFFVAVASLFLLSSFQIFLVKTMTPFHMHQNRHLLALMLPRTKSKIGNPAKQNKLKNSSFTYPFWMFKNGIIASSPISPIPLQWFKGHLQAPVYANSPSSASDSNTNFVTKGLYSSKLNSLISVNLTSY